MAGTLEHARAEAESHERDGPPAKALSAWVAVVRSFPQDPLARLGVARALRSLGEQQAAVRVFAVAARICATTGHPLAALVAAHEADGKVPGTVTGEVAGTVTMGARGTLAEPASGEPGAVAAAVIDALATIYGTGSRHLAHQGAVATAAGAPDSVVPEGRPLTDEQGYIDAAAALQIALDEAPFAGWQQVFRPLPFLSDLGPTELKAVLRAARVTRFAAGAHVLRQGAPGDALHFLATGRVRVVRSRPGSPDQVLATLHENSLFGEMALLTSQPRSASVVAVTSVDIIEVSRRTLDAIAQRHPAVALTLGRFTRERLIRNLLATSPLFTPFTRAQQADLLQRFDGLEVADGVTLISRGSPGTGLYVVLAGEVEVTEDDQVAGTAAGGGTPLARLGPGAMFGEMSLLRDQPASATVRAKGAATVLFLPRLYFERLVAAVPSLRSYFDELATSREHAAPATLQSAPDPTAGETDAVLL